MSICVRSVDEVKRTESTPRAARERTRAATITPMHAQQQIEVDLRRLRHQGECERPVGRWRAVGATGSWMPVPGSLDPLTSTTEELCGCLGRGSTGPSSRRAGRGPGHKTRVAAPAGEPGASHKGRLGGRLRQQWQAEQACRGRRQALSRWPGIAPECSCGARAALAAVPSAGSVLE